MPKVLLCDWIKAQGFVMDLLVHSITLSVANMSREVSQVLLICSLLSKTTVFSTVLALTVRWDKTQSSYKQAK